MGNTTCARRGQRRWGIDIIACILKASSHGVKKTDLMNRCNLSFVQQKRYLDLTLKKGLVVVEKRGNYLFFKTSKKGKALLKSYENLEVLIA